jgi:hypothetical protein
VSGRRAVTGRAVTVQGTTVAGAVVAVVGALALTAAQEREYKSTLPADHPAIAALATTTDDAVSRLAAPLASGETRLERRDGPLGYLPALLTALDVPVDSQMLVFSKTSVQAARVSPERPRAIYFGDEVAIAHVPGASGLEVIAVDPRRGPVFYAVNEATTPPTFTPTRSCLQCHHGPNTAGVPGLYVGSVIPGPTGAPLRDDTAIITDHTSAFADRWGGWYVTARRGEQPDRANAVASNPADPSSLVRESRPNLSNLMGLVDLRGYLAPTSDIVALMVFEHQTQMTNLLTRVGWQMRIAERTMPGRALESRALAEDLDDLVAYMLFRDEARMVEPIEGVSTFARTFAARGRRDRRGRSLRELDLTTRLFRFPLSYLIEGRAFAELPPPVREAVLRRLYEALTTDGPGVAAHLSAVDRRAIVEIAAETVPRMPSWWR